MSKFLRSGIYSLKAGAFGLSNYYIILLQKKDETCIIYVFDCNACPTNLQIHRMILDDINDNSISKMDFVEIRYSFLEKHVDGYLGQTSLQLHDNLFDVYKYKSSKN